VTSPIRYHSIDTAITIEKLRDLGDILSKGTAKRYPVRILDTN
jgi:hypothetical protein